MHKLTVVLMTMLLVLSPSVFAGTSRPSAQALSWYLEAQGKLSGASIRTRQLPNGTFEIFEWRVTGVPQPTDTEVNIIIDNYKASLIQDATDKALDKLVRNTAEANLKNTPRTENSIVGLRNRIANIERFLFGNAAQ